MKAAARNAWGLVRLYWFGLHFRRAPAHLVFPAYADLFGFGTWIVGFATGHYWLCTLGVFAIWSSTWYILGRFHGWREGYHDAHREQQRDAMVAFSEMAPHMLADEDLEMPDDAREALQEIYRAAQSELGREG